MKTFYELEKWLVNIKEIMYCKNNWTYLGYLPTSFLWDIRDVVGYVVRGYLLIVTVID